MGFAAHAQQEPAKACLEAGSPTRWRALPMTHGTERASTGLAPERAGKGRGAGPRVAVACGAWCARLTPAAVAWKPKDLPRFSRQRGRAPLQSPHGWCPVRTGPSGSGRVPVSMAWTHPPAGLSQGFQGLLMLGVLSGSASLALRPPPCPSSEIRLLYLRPSFPQSIRPQD